jgi:hypothetical protein
MTPNLTWTITTPGLYRGSARRDWDVDTTVIAMRLKKLDGYLRGLRQMQTVSLNEYLDEDNIQTIIEA